MFSCLGHVINLGNIDVMGHIMKIVAVENATAIWEYDPTRQDNHVLGSSLDVIAAIRTLAIKVSNYVYCSWKLNISHCHMLLLFRFKHQDNASSTSRVPRSFAGFLRC